SMPGDIALVFRCRVHRPADKPWAVAFFEDSRDLAVGHHATARDSHDDAIDLLEYLIEIGIAGRLGDWATRRGSDRANRIAPSPPRSVSASLFRDGFTHVDSALRRRRAGNK